jgi:hypothetical protein
LIKPNALTLERKVMRALNTSEVVFVSAGLIGAPAGGALASGSGGSGSSSGGSSTKDHVKGGFWGAVVAKAFDVLGDVIDAARKFEYGHGPYGDPNVPGDSTAPNPNHHGA